MIKNGQKRSKMEKKCSKPSKTVKKIVKNFKINSQNGENSF